jgi:hypothetical protein
MAGTYLFKNPVYPYSNVNPTIVNTDGSTYSGGFNSTETSLNYGLPALRNNVMAANASVMNGGGKGSKKHYILIVIYMSSQKKNLPVFFENIDPKNIQCD